MERKFEDYSDSELVTLIEQISLDESQSATSRLASSSEVMVELLDRQAKAVSEKGGYWARACIEHPNGEKEPLYFSMPLPSATSRESAIKDAEQTATDFMAQVGSSTTVNIVQVHGPDMPQ